MEFSQRDMAILISMPLAIIVLNFAFTGIGLAEDSVSENEIPEYNIPEDRFNLQNTFPEFPGNPGSGTLKYYYNNSQAYNEHTKKINDDVRVQATEYTQGPLYDANVTMWAIYDNGTEQLIGQRVLYGQYHNDTIEPTIIYSDGTTVNYSVRFILNDIRKDMGTKGDALIVDYTVETSKSDDSWLSQIPIIGSVINTADKLAQGLFWLGSIFSWVGQTLFELILAMVLTIFDSLVFGIDLISWILTSYNDIITNASGFASLFVALPGVMLSLELLKVGFIVVHLLPTT